jgi:glycosyltransferase involved in cell wall biosynthesis
MKLTLAIPFFNQLNDVKGIMGLLKHVTSPSVEWLIIDNGSSDPVEDFFYHTLKPKRLEYVKNGSNVGMVATYNQIFSLIQTDIVAILHNDVFIFEKGWDKRVVTYFETINRLGSLGFFGAQGVGTIGERIQDPEFPGQMAGISHMLEASQHGLDMQEAYRPCAILDGFAMVFNMHMIKQAGGLDTRYHYHHLYDRDLPLTSLSLGYKNIVVNVPCHHQSGVTANRHQYQAWIDSQLKMKSGGDQWTHEENSKLFAKKWQSALPLYIESDFTFRKGRHHQWDFKGDAILKPSR